MENKITIILPVANERNLIHDTLTHLASLGADEVIVVDGASSDGTDEIVRTEFPGVRLFHTAYPDRSLQMNLGAFEAIGDIFLFVHADMRLPMTAIPAIRSKIKEGHVGGGFKKQYTPSNASLRFYEFCLNEFYLSWMRCLVGTNAMFVTRETFKIMNGFHDQPFLEDLVFAECLKRYGRVAVIPARVQVSSRRYFSNGIMKQILRNLSVMIRYKLLRHDPSELRDVYEVTGQEVSRPVILRADRPEGSPRSFDSLRSLRMTTQEKERSSRVVIYFVKYPEPGRVKTRLARDIGYEKAAEIYKDLVESNLKVLAQIREPFRLILAFDPAEKEQKIRTWLEPFQILDFLPQQGTTLGERLENAFNFAFNGNAKRVMTLGSDTMGLTPQIINEGFEALHEYDCVIGPAKDGGYYLIGLPAKTGSSRSCERAGIKGFRPTGGLEIFSDIPWSTSMVYQNTVQYLEKEQLAYYKLPELEDLDDVKNLKPALPAGREGYL